MTFAQFSAALTMALVPVIASGLAALIAALFAKVITQVAVHFGKAAADKTAKYMRILQDLADQTAVAMQQMIVDDLKATGKFDKAAAEKVKKDAVDLGLKALGTLRDQIESQLLIDVPTVLGLLVELSVSKLKPAAPAPAAVPAAPPTAPAQQAAS